MAQRRAVGRAALGQDGVRQQVLSWLGEEERESLAVVDRAWAQSARRPLSWGAARMPPRGSRTPAQERAFLRRRVNVPFTEIRLQADHRELYALRRLERVEVLELDSVTDMRGFLQLLPRLPRLHTLVVRSDVHLDTSALPPRLVVLDLRCPGLDDDAWPGLARLTQLETLTLFTDRGFTCEGLPVAPWRNRLRALHMEPLVFTEDGLPVRCTNEGLERVASLGALQRLSLYATPDAGAAAHVWRRMHRLVELALDAEMVLDDSASLPASLLFLRTDHLEVRLEALWRQCPRLEELRCVAGAAVLGEDWPANRRLHYLELEAVADPEHLATLAHCTGLTSLRIGLGAHLPNQELELVRVLERNRGLRNVELLEEGQGLSWSDETKAVLRERGVRPATPEPPLPLSEHLLDGLVSFNAGVATLAVPAVADALIDHMGDWAVAGPLAAAALTWATRPLRRRWGWSV